MTKVSNQPQNMERYLCPFVVWMFYQIIYFGSLASLACIFGCPVYPGYSCCAAVTSSPLIMLIAFSLCSSVFITTKASPWKYLFSFAFIDLSSFWMRARCLTYFLFSRLRTSYSACFLIAYCRFSTIFFNIFYSFEYSSPFSMMRISMTCREGSLLVRSRVILYLLSDCPLGMF